MEMHGRITYYDPETNDIVIIAECLYTIEYADNNYGYTLSSIDWNPEF